MRKLLWLAILLPSLAWAAPAESEWEQAVGASVTVVFLDGSKLTGTLVSVSGRQAKVRKPNGEMSLVPTQVVSEIQQSAPARQVTAPDQPATAPAKPAKVPSEVVQPSTRGRQLKRTPIVGVRYPVKGDQYADFLFYDDLGQANTPSGDVLRTRALREFVFIDQWGNPVALQTVWARMGAEEDFVKQVKSINLKILPFRAAEIGLAVGGIGLGIYGYNEAVQAGRDPATDPTVISGTVLALSNILFNLAATTPQRNRLEGELGLRSIERAQDFWAVE